MQAAKYISALVFTAFLLFSTEQINAQNSTLNNTSEQDTTRGSNIKGPLEFEGHVKELSKKLKGAIVTLYQTPDGSYTNLTEIFKTVTGGNGQFEFKLEVNKMFVLSVEKGGYTTKRIDFDTDVLLARSEYTKIPKFEFEVHMVKDLDGLAFSGSVANVFYQIKQNKFDYELDYSKEEMEEEERLLRVEEEKRRLAEQAAQKNFELQEMGKFLLEQESASAEEIIAASIEFGAGDKQKIVKGFETVFSESDTLRKKKALAMYDQLIEEKEKAKASGGQIDNGAIYLVAKELGSEVKQEAKKERTEKLKALRVEKEEAEQKKQEVMSIQQKALEEEMKETLAAAIAKDELKKKQEGKEKRDGVYYAIFNSYGDSKTAIKNLIKTYPKGDAYAEKKAKALYTEYEKSRLTGTTLSKMDFGKLFQAASNAEQKAITEDITFDNSKQNSKLDAFKKKIEERKQEQQAQVMTKIQLGLQEAPKDRASQIAVFKDALPKNETDKEMKAEAMYKEYVTQKRLMIEIEQELKTTTTDSAAQLAVFFNALPADAENREVRANRMYRTYVKNQNRGGSGKVSMDFSALFEASDYAEQDAMLAAKEEQRRVKLVAQDKLDVRREELRKENQVVTAQVEKSMEKVHSDNASNVQAEKTAKMKQAFENGSGDRDNTVRAIMKTIPQTGDKELDRDRAEAVYDAYLEEKRNAKQSGNTNLQIDFGELFKAADNAEIAKLQRQHEAKIAKKEIKNKEYEETRTEQLTDLAEAEQKKAVKDAERAEAAYENTQRKVEAARQERLSAEKKADEQREKQLAMEQAARLAKEEERKDEELAIVRKEKEVRLAREEKEAELAALKIKAERKKIEQEAQQEADRLLAEAEKQQLLAEAAAQKTKDEREKEEAKRLADAAKAEKANELAKLKAEQEAKQEAKDAEAKRIADAAKAEKADQLAKLKVEQEAKDAEAKRIADAEKAKKEQQLADAKAADEEKKAEEKRIADAAKAKKLANEQEIKAAAESKKREEERLAALAKKDAEEAERKRLADYNRLISEGDIAITKEDYKKGRQNYKDALALYPNNKDASNKFGEADAQLKRIDKAAAEQLAQDERYNKFMLEGKEAFTESQYDLAKEKFKNASEIKPTEQDPKQQIRNIDRKMAAIAQVKKEDAAKERKYILLMQDGANALEENNLDLAKNKYEEAAFMKPQDTEPKAKLSEIADLETQLAAADLAKQRKEEEAQREFERKKEVAKQKAEEIKKARELAIGAVDNQKAEESTNIEAQEKTRLVNYEKLKKAVAEMDLDAEEQRLAFLSELAKIYPEGLTKEVIQGKNFVLTRHVINQKNVVTIYEQKAWDWGGIFHFKNSDIAITKSIYELEIGKFK